MIGWKGVSAAALLLVALGAGWVAYWWATPRDDEAAVAPQVVAPRAVAPVAVARPSTAPHRGARATVHRLAPITTSPSGDYPLVATKAVPAAPASAAPAILVSAAPPAPDPAAAAAALASDDGSEKRALTPAERAREDADEDAAARDADQVRFVIAAHLPQARACYERELKNGAPGGRVEVGFTIAADGHPIDVHVASDTTGSPSLGACICARVASWTFPRPVGGQYALTYPFMFAKGG